MYIYIYIDVRNVKEYTRLTIPCSQLEARSFFHLISEVWDSPFRLQTLCYEKGMKWNPLNMDGQSRVPEWLDDVWVSRDLG